MLKAFLNGILVKNLGLLLKGPLGRQFDLLFLRIGMFLLDFSAIDVLATYLN
jgi:hypothetical protein